MTLRRKPPPVVLNSLPQPSSLDITATPSTPFPTHSSLSLPAGSLSSPSTTAVEPQLLTFLKTHLTPPITPQTFHHFLSKKLHRHPKFSQFDFHLFQWASISLPTFRHTYLTYEWMVRTLAITDRFTLLNHLLFELIPSNPCPCSDGIFGCQRIELIYQFAINAYFRVRRSDDGLHAFNIMRKLIDGRPNVGVYNIMIHGFVKNWEMGKALQMFDRLVKDRVRPDLFTYNIMISGYCKNSDMDGALRVVDEMRRVGIKPNVVSFNTLITGYFREKRFDDGVKLAYWMIEDGCGLSPVTCEILVDGLCRAGKVAMACDLVVDFMGKGTLPSGFGCCDLIERLCNCREEDVGKALNIVEGMWEKGNAAPSLIGLTCLIDGLRKVGKLEDAIRVMEKMLEEGIVMDSVSFNCLLQDACKVGRTAAADTLRLVASSKGLLDPDGVTFRILVDGYTREGKRKEGEKVVDEMLDAGFITDIGAYNRLMQGLSSGKCNGRLLTASST